MLLPEFQGTKKQWKPPRFSVRSFLDDAAKDPEMMEAIRWRLTRWLAVEETSVTAPVVAAYHGMTNDKKVKDVAGTIMKDGFKYQVGQVVTEVATVLHGLSCDAGTTLMVIPLLLESQASYRSKKHLPTFFLSVNPLVSCAYPATSIGLEKRILLCLKIEVNAPSHYKSACTGQTDGVRG